MNRRKFLWSAALIAGFRDALFAQPRSRSVRIGVFGLFRPAELLVRAAAGDALAVDDGRSTTVVRGRETVHLRLADRQLLVQHPGGQSRTSSVRLAGADGRSVGLELSVPDRIARTFHGALTVTASGAALTPVVAMSIETAVASVVAAEQTGDTPLAALQAQAVAARSYFLAAHGRHRGFDFCDTTHCQFLREAPATSHRAAIAAEQTAGLALLFRGAPVAALYSASCGGRTRTLEEAGLSGEGAYPFFAVACAHCAVHAPEWQRRLALDADASRLEAERTEAARIAVVRRNGWSAVPGNTFDVSREDGSLVLEGRGSGHGIGLCQAGAAALASEGATFVEILQRYYPGTIVDGVGGSP